MNRVHCMTHHTCDVRSSLPHITRRFLKPVPGEDKVPDIMNEKDWLRSPYWFSLPVTQNHHPSQATNRLLFLSERTSYVTTRQVTTGGDLWNEKLHSRLTLIMQTSQNSHSAVREKLCVGTADPSSAGDTIRQVFREKTMLIVSLLRDDLFDENNNPAIKILSRSVSKLDANLTVLSAVHTCLHLYCIWHVSMVSVRGKFLRRKKIKQTSTHSYTITRCRHCLRKSSNILSFLWRRYINMSPSRAP